MSCGPCHGASWPLVWEVAAGAVERAQAIRQTVGAPPPAPPLSSATSRSFSASSLLAARGDHAFQLAAPEQACRGPSRHCLLPCDERDTASGLGGEGSGTPGTSPWAPPAGGAAERRHTAGRRVQSGSPDGCGHVAWPRRASL